MLYKNKEYKNMRQWDKKQPHVKETMNKSSISQSPAVHTLSFESVLMAHHGASIVGFIGR